MAALARFFPAAALILLFVLGGIGIWQIKAREYRIGVLCMYLGAIVVVLVAASRS